MTHPDRVVIGQRVQREHPGKQQRPHDPIGGRAPPGPGARAVADGHHDTQYAHAARHTADAVTRSGRIDRRKPQATEATSID